jgi:hypothetical protein
MRLSTQHKAKRAAYGTITAARRAFHGWNRP